MREYCRGQSTCYFRLNGKRIALPGAKGSAEFDAAYDTLFAEAQRTKAARKQESKQRTEQRERNAKGGVASVEWFIQKFLASEFFVSQHGKAPIFAPGTQRNYRPVLERMCLDTMKGMATPIGKAKLADFTPKTARNLSAQGRRALSADGGAHTAHVALQSVAVCHAVR
jgi:hypothetical protein